MEGPPEFRRYSVRCQDPHVTQELPGFMDGARGEWRPLIPEELGYDLF